MTKFFVLAILSCLAVVLGHHGGDHGYISEAFGHQTHDFILKMFNDVNEAYKNESFVISPFEMRLIIQSLIEMSGGDTRKELLAALENVKTFEEGRTTFHEYLEVVRKNEHEVHFQDALNLYVASRYIVSEKTSSVLKKFYNVSVTSADFDFPDIALSDVLHFEGNWKYPLDPAPFGKNLMEVTAPFYYLESRIFDSKILRIPYKNRRFALFVFLPNDPQGVDKIFEKFNTLNIQTEMLHLDEESVRLIMPRFTAVFQVELKDLFMKNGVRKVFDENAADLRGLIRSNTSVAVSSIVQNIDFVVDEGNKESRRDQEEEVNNRAGMEFKDFNVNRPFVYFVEAF
jgi:serine protease inhibitor